MPHLVLLYTANLEQEADISGLCRTLCDTMLVQCDETGKQVFPTGGTRVLAYPAAHSAVADGQGDYGFLYMNLRMAKCRSPQVHQQMGEALKAAVGQYLADVLASKPLGITVQIDEGHEVFDGKHSTLHPLFNKA
jgi:5-carboxymethyl-2-hydroxymuconate isomerase